MDLEALEFRLPEIFHSPQEVVRRPGDFVLVSEDRLARGKWPRARVEATHTGRDGLVWSVTLRMSSGNLIRRPVQHLRLLDTCDTDLAVERDIVEHCC